MALQYVLLPVAHVQTCVVWATTFQRAFAVLFEQTLPVCAHATVHLQDRVCESIMVCVYAACFAGHVRAVLLSSCARACIFERVCLQAKTRIRERVFEYMWDNLWICGHKRINFTDVFVGQCCAGIAYAGAL